jgi:glutaredoxin
MTKYTVYWQPGCTSCLKAREFLRAHGIEFESVNVRDNPAATAELARLGARAVPVIVRDGRFVLGQDLEEIARFIGVRHDRERLPPSVLAARLVALLDAAARCTRQIPAMELHTALPGRRRTRLDLAYHVPMIVAGLLDACTGGCLTYEHFNRKPPERIRTGGDAALVTERLARSFGQWWSSNAASLPEHVDTYYGEQPFAAVLERTTWHVAQHVRQLASLLERPGTPSAQAVPVELFDGLPMPAEVWDAELPPP